MAKLHHNLQLSEKVYKPISETKLTKIFDAVVTRPRQVKAFRPCGGIFFTNINTLWPGDAIWRRGTRPTLAQVMVDIYSNVNRCTSSVPLHMILYW